MVHAAFVVAIVLAQADDADRLERRLDALLIGLESDVIETRAAVRMDLRALSSSAGTALRPMLVRRLARADAEARECLRVELDYIDRRELEAHWERVAGHDRWLEDVWIQRLQLQPADEEPVPPVEVVIEAQREEREGFLTALLIGAFAIWMLCAFAQRYGGGAPARRSWPVLPGAWKLHFGPRPKPLVRTVRCKLPC